MTIFELIPTLLKAGLHHPSIEIHPHSPVKGVLVVEVMAYKSRGGKMITWQDFYSPDYWILNGPHILDKACEWLILMAADAGGGI